MSSLCAYSECTHPQVESTVYGLCTTHEKKAKRILAGLPATQSGPLRLPCRSCGRTSINYGRGLCHNCYRAAKAAGTLDQFPLLSRKKATA